MNFPFFRLLFLFIIFSIFSTCNTSPSHPIIGILTQPTTNYPDFGKVYVPSSYVKWIEASGGKAVYIDYQLSHSELEQLFNKVNGLVFIGGGLDIDPHIKYIDSAWYLFNLTKQAYDKHNEWVPIWGTCLGFQMLSVFSTGDLDFLDRFDSWDMALPLNFTTQLKESRIFKGIPSSYLNYFQKYNVTINWHTYGVTSGYQTKHKESFQKYSSFFRIVSNNSGRKGKNFVSTIESYRYPIYGSQWHPECVNYGGGEHVAVDYPRAVSCSSYVGQFFINEARKNSHTFGSLENAWDLLFLNKCPIFDKNLFSSYESVYFW